MDSANQHIYLAIRDKQSQFAKYYALLSAETGIRYPAAGALLITPFQPPTGTPNGTYLIHYYAEPNGQKLPGPAIQPTVTIAWTPDQAHQITASSGPETTLAALGKNFREQALLNNDPAMRAAAIDYIKQESAIKLAIEQQRFLRDGRTTAELGEMQNYTMVVRQEYQEIMEFAALVQKRTLEQHANFGERMMEFMQKTFNQWSELLQRTATPPQPVDYNPTLVELIRTARDIPIALIQARSGAPQPSPRPVDLPGDTPKPVQPDASQRSAPASQPAPSPPPTPSPADLEAALRSVLARLSSQAPPARPGEPVAPVPRPPAVVDPTGSVRPDQANKQAEAIVEEALAQLLNPTGKK